MKNNKNYTIKKNIKNSYKKKHNKNTNKRKQKRIYKNKGGSGKYIYYPKDNIIQFMPYSYPNINQNSQVYQQPYLGNQMGGDILPTQCGDFNPNMLVRKFDCNQPFWSSKCT